MQYLSTDTKPNGPFLLPNQFTFTRAVSRVVSNYLSLVYFVFVSVVSRFAFIYIDNRSRDANLLVYSRLSSNPLEKALGSNLPEHSTASRWQSLDKNILRHYCRAKEKKRYMYQAIENESDVISYNTRAALQGNAIIIF